MSAELIRRKIYIYPRYIWTSVTSSDKEVWTFIPLTAVE